MIRIVYILPILFLFSCHNSDNENELESFGENKSQGDVASCACNILVEDEHEVLLKDGEPYTGICYTNYKDSENKYIEKQILNGMLNGSIKYFSRTGDVLFEEKFEQGTYQVDLQIEDVRCNCQDLKKYKDNRRAYYKGQVFKGLCFSDFPQTEQPYVEVNYKNGYRDGYTTYFNRAGDILYTEMYDKDTLLNVIYPKK